MAARKKPATSLRENVVIGAKGIPPMGKRLDTEKARRAAADPRRPGEVCRAEPGAWAPRIELRRCEGKGDCVDVCPYEVFRVEPIDEAAYRALPPLARFKLWVHGKRVATTPGIEACRACGLCVVACPERAITLEKRT